MASSRTVSRRAAAGLQTTVRVCATLTVIAIFAQGVSAGEILGGFPVAKVWHGIGALVVLVLTLVTAVASGLWWRASRGPRWPAVLAAIVFVASIVQARFGAGAALTVHVPLALVLMVGACLVAAWTWLDRGPVRRPVDS